MTYKSGIVYKDPTIQKEGIFTFTLYRSSNVSEKTIHKSRKKSREKIIEQITINPSITMKELAETIGVSVKAIEKQLANLKKQGKIEREGPDKGGKWKVIKSNN